jgi:hypothetical protein
MRINATLTLLSFFLSFQLFAQPDTSVRYFPDRYKLDIPEEWKKPKIINAITEILPKTIGDYIDSNKQFCTECRAGLTVTLLIELPVFNSKGDTYQFRASLALFDSTGKELIELSLVSLEEVHKVKVIPTYTKEPSRFNNGDYITNVSRDRDGKIVNIVKIPLSPPPINNGVPAYNKDITTLYDLMKTAESKLYQIEDILLKIEKEKEKKKS